MLSSKNVNENIGVYEAGLVGRVRIYQQKNSPAFSAGLFEITVRFNAG
jgi:hypothetical protein